MDISSEKSGEIVEDVDDLTRNVFNFHDAPEQVLIGVLGFMWILFLWDTYLSCRQRHLLIATKSVPPEVSSFIDADIFNKARVYAVDKSYFGLASNIYSTIEMTIILYYHVIAWVWARVLNDIIIINDFILGTTGYNLNLTPDHEITCSLLFLIYVSLFSFVDSLPWSLYRTFVLEERHGFNKQTLGFFIKDKIKGLVVSLIIGLPIAAALLLIIKIGGQYFYIYAYLFAFTVTMFMMYVYPEFIAPLFDRYEPFPEGELKSRIESLAARISFPLRKLLVVEGSKRSSHSNAYMYGFGKNKRIVVYDTLLKGFVFPKKRDPSPIAPASSDSTSGEPTDDSGSSASSHGGDSVANDRKVRGCNDDEVLAVLGHELGHWQLYHTIIHLAVSQINIFFMFAVFAFLMNETYLFAAFGFIETQIPTLIRLIVIFQFIFTPYYAVIEFVTVILTRKLEFQADAFSVGLGYGSHMTSALINLEIDNLSCPVHDWLFSMFNFSHPPLLERLAAIDTILRKQT